MKIELYKIEMPKNYDLAGQVHGIMKEGLHKRTRTRGEGEHRLEAIEIRGKLFLCDFIKIRTKHGPAKAGRHTAAVGFELNHDQGFGEETAFLWDTSNNWCVLQYNHYGVRAAVIAEYLALYNHAAPVPIVLHPKIDDNIQAKILAKKVVKKLSFSVAVKQLSDADFEHGNSLGGAAKILKKTDADQIVKGSVNSFVKGSVNSFVLFGGCEGVSQ